MSTLPRNRDAVHSDPASWPAWTDEMRYAPLVNLFDPALDDDAGPLPPFEEPEVDGVAYKLEDFLDEASSYYRSLGTGAGAWLAAELAALADLARELGAPTAAEFDRARMSRDADRAEDLVYAGIVRGRAEALEDGPGLDGYGHDC